MVERWRSTVCSTVPSRFSTPAPVNVTAPAPEMSPPTFKVLAAMAMVPAVRVRLPPRVRLAPLAVTPAALLTTKLLREPVETVKI